MTTRATATSYRSNADGSAVCPHRDLSVCDACAAADPDLHEVVGVHFHLPGMNAADVAEILAEIR